MKANRPGIPAIAWVGVFMLVFSAAMLSLGHRDSVTQPGSESFAPSGISAWRVLLEQKGFDVRVDRSARPRFYPDDTVIGFFQPKAPGFFDMFNEISEEEPDVYKEPVQDSIHTFLDHGGRALLLPIAQDFPTVSRDALRLPPMTVTSRFAKGTYKVSSVPATTTPFLDHLDQYHDRASSLWTTSNGIEAVHGLQVGDGFALVAWNGLGMTNRFIDQHDNAAFFLRLLNTVAGSSRRVVILDSTWDVPQERSLVEAIGPWANAAWQQALFLAVVIVFTLGKRFGFAEQVRSRERGSREMVDAVADTMARGKAANMAMSIALDRADTRLRNHLKLSRDADRATRDERLPETLQSALAMLEIASKDREAPPSDALRRIQRVERELNAFLDRGQRETPRKRR